MNILLLGPKRPELERFITAMGDQVTYHEELLDADHPAVAEAEFLISYGYRHILRQPVLDRFEGRAINLHIAMLPWNRGADPNLWSFLEDTPKGVTIHALDTGVDTGPILVQQAVGMDLDRDTLKTSYDRLTQAIESLFIASWPAIRAGRIAPQPQPPGGSVHRLRDKEPYLPLLTRGWDTPVLHLVGKALKSRG